MKIIGEKPRPRMLIEGFGQNEVEQLSSLVPTSFVLEKRRSVREAEWDLLVTKEGAQYAAEHLYVVGFGGPFGSTLMGRERGGERYWATVAFSGTTIATEFVVAPDLDPLLAPLVERVLVPLVRSRSENSTLEASRHLGTGQFGRRIPPSAAARRLRPWLTTTEPKVLAGSFDRVGGAEIWCLPEEVADDPVPWVRTALSMWHRRDVRRFPVDPLWRDNPDWLTTREVTLVEDLRRLEQERKEVEAKLEERSRELRQELDEAQAEADTGDRLLLTGAGDELVSVVERSLQRLGFTVENRDEVNPPTDRLEDLWVTDPESDPEWIALAEVRSYSKGAAVKDLLRLSGRFAKRFVKAQGREPSRMWYIVNQFSRRDPSSRPPPLESNPHELAEFEAEGGMVMDTGELFRLLKLVESGERTPADVRVELRHATGLWRALGSRCRSR